MNAGIPRKAVLPRPRKGIVAPALREDKGAVYGFPDGEQSCVPGRAPGWRTPPALAVCPRMVGGEPHLSSVGGHQGLYA